MNSRVSVHMNHFARAIGLGLAFVAAVSSSSVAQTAGTPAGLKRQEWTIAGVKRSGFIAAPAKAAAGLPTPLVLVFHGHGGTAANMSRALPIHKKWPEAIVVYLQGAPAPGAIVDGEGRRAGWQSAPGALGDRDLRFVDTVLAWSKRTYAVDAKRVFAAGHSNGGWFTYVLWAARPEQFTAFAPAAAVFGRMAASAKPKPALIIAGEKDKLVSFALQRRTIAAVVDLNQAATKGEPWFGGAEMHDSEIADVVTYVHPGGHPLPANASDVVTRFFKSY